MLCLPNTSSRHIIRERSLPLRPDSIPQLPLAATRLPLLDLEHDSSSARLMANETGPSPPAAGNAAGEKKEQNQPAKAQPAAQGEAAAAGEKKLSNAELKKKAKEEKAARRAAAKATHPPPPPGAQGGASDGKGGKGKGNKQDGHPAAHHHRAASKSVLPPPAIKDNKPKVPECFSHLSMAKRIPFTQADKDVHPAVLRLGQRMAFWVIPDSLTRVEATLLAFKKVNGRISSRTASAKWHG